MRGALTPVALLIALGIGQFGGDSQPLPKVSGSLVRVRGSTRGDSAIEVRVDVAMTEGWHIGARQPGKVGIPTKLEWQLPKGWSVTSEDWPAPKAAPVGRDSAFTYTGPFSIHAILVGPKTTVKEPIQAVLSYGICREMCIPGEVTLRLSR
jgi:thiol:disulfide interchange protein DsbD